MNKIDPFVLDSITVYNQDVLNLYSQWPSPNVIVSDGVVELWGWADSEEERTAIILAVENTPGVKSVESNITVTVPYMPSL